MIEIFEKFSREIPTAVTEARMGGVGYMPPRYHRHLGGMALMPCAAS
jgi:hypothetical protein